MAASKDVANTAKNTRPKPPNAGKGRPKGSLNKTTASIKAALLEAFEQRGGVGALVKWATTNETEFYKLCGRLIPTEITGKDGAPLIPELPNDERQARVLTLLQTAKARRKA